MRGPFLMPWRNGAGVTREIAREPAQGEHFAWRLSLASLQGDGPFSSYTGYQRCVALVEGRGFRLHVAGTGTKTLAASGAHLLFAGAAHDRVGLAVERRFAFDRSRRPDDERAAQLGRLVAHEGLFERDCGGSHHLSFFPSAAFT